MRGYLKGILRANSGVLERFFLLTCVVVIYVCVCVCVYVYIHQTVHLGFAHFIEHIISKKFIFFY